MDFRPSIVRAVAFGIIAIVATATPASAQVVELFISEYVEGSGNNRALEIFNGSAGAIALSNYRIEIYLNGAVAPTSIIPLSGSLAAGGTVVYAHPSAHADILAVAQFTSTQINFNGNDAIVLRRVFPFGVVDLIGRIGEDPPGGSWSGGGMSTVDHTLRRKPEVCVGDLDPSNSYNPALEWIAFPSNTFNGLGSHSITCTVVPACSIDPPSSMLLGGAEHYKTVTVFIGGAPVSNAIVQWEIIAGPHAGVFAETDVTNANGQALFGYAGSIAGVDTIQATVTSLNPPPVCTAAVTWISPAVFINEIDSATSPIAPADFIELYDGGAGHTALDGLVVVLYGGVNDETYASYDLDQKSTDANGYFVLGEPSVIGAENLHNKPLTTNLQSAPAVVALFLGDWSVQPGIEVITLNLRDALLYGPSVTFDIELSVLVNPGQPQVDENAFGVAAQHSIQRCPNGSGGMRNTVTYVASAPTPGAANAFATTPNLPTANPSTVACQGSSVLTVSPNIESPYGIRWTSGVCGGPTVGMGAVVNVTPNQTTDYFVHFVSLNGCEGLCAGPLTVTVVASLDINNDGSVSPLDIPFFANVLVGNDTDPLRVARSDVNCDGVLSGRDVPPFVDAVLP